MTCESFRTACSAGEDTPEMREHLRACTACLEVAVAADPDFLFRSLGGEMTPPGGVDAFVSSVMGEIGVRSAEKKMRRTGFFPVLRWSVAAAAMIGVIGTAMLHRNATAPITIAPVHVASIQRTVAAIEPRPVVENYQSSNATIVEVPNQENSDVKIVMIFDDSLPADL